MNFVCDRCKQKYHVADEKLQGRAVTRFRCKKCENVIELDLAAIAKTTPSPESEAPTVTAPTVTAPTVAKPVAKGPTTAPLARPRAATMVGGPAPKPAPRPRAATVTGTALGGASPARATAAAAAPDAARERTTSAILNASENGWYAGIRDLPVGPLTRKELLAKVQSGDVTPDTLVWREGLDDWRPLRNVAELGDMLRAGAQKISGSLLDEMGKRPAPAPRGAQVVPIGAARGASARPSVTEEEEATRVTGLDPSIAAMAARALAKEKEKPLADEEEAPEGSEDETLVNQRRAAAAPIAPKAPARPAPTSVRPPPAAPEPPAAKVSEPPPPAPVSTRPAASAAATSSLDDLPEDLFAKAPRPDPAAIAPPSAATLNLAPLAPPAAAPLAPAPMPVVSPMPAVASAAAPVVATSIPPQTAAQSQRPGGLSAGVLVLIGGVLVAGVGLGIFIGRKNNAPAAPPEVARAAPAPAPAPVAAPVPAVPAPSVGEPVVAEPVPEPVPEPVAQNPAQTPPGTTAPAAPAESNGSRSHGSGSHARAPSTTATRPALSAQELAMLRELGGQGASATGGGPVGNTQMRASATPSATANNTGESDTARFNRAVRTFQSSRVADNCWQQVLRQNPALRSGAVQISFTVTNAGRFTSFDVTNSPDPRFTQCIRSRGGSLAPLGGGSQINGQVSVNLTAN